MSLVLPVFVLGVARYIAISPLSTPKVVMLRCIRRFSTSKKSKRFSVDVSELVQNKFMWPSEKDLAEIVKNKEPLTPMAIELRSIIRGRGPIPVHDYMSQSLHHFQHGYYQRSAEKIGSGGDFITSPEISTLFGEMIAIWVVATWEQLGEPAHFNLVEMGPGKGTLIADIVRVSRRFPAFHRAMSVHLVELSNSMRQLQYKTLGCIGEPMPVDASQTSSESPNEKDEGHLQSVRSRTANGVSVTWHYYTRQLPNDVPSIAVAHEFLDAFPVHQFARTERGWREKYVDVDLDKDSPLHFRYVLYPDVTNPVTVYNQFLQRAEESVTATTNSIATAQRANEMIDILGAEISPLALGTVEETSHRIMKQGGAALFIDYGEWHNQADTLRGFHKHKSVDPLSSPGENDLTADVDFGMCRFVAEKEGVGVKGSKQGDFLMRLGIVSRIERYIEKHNPSGEEMKKILDSLEKLVASDMGSRFKVMALLPEKIKTSPGFD